MENTTPNQIVELKDERDYDYNRSINRHSTRTYQYQGSKFYLDRNLSFEPRHFSLYYFPVGGCIARSIKVNDEDYWGEGISWKKAEAIMRETLLNKDRTQ